MKSPGAAPAVAACGYYCRRWSEGVRQQAAAPVLADSARRTPQAATARRFEQDVRAVLPDHADRIRRHR
ncbi:hypothetical protein ACFV2S_16110 [Streptomyces sp. NPDC059695]|uniref:hypothetical protein n=1 Tax=Streptomyces sp. NPDC059695 TaxID=3346910 RepID=UPI0036A25495